MRRVTIVLASLAVLVLFTASGLARGSANRLMLRASGVNGSVSAVTSGTRWSVSGSLTRFVRGQRIVVHAFDDGRLILSRKVRLTRSGFTVPITVAGVGRVTVRAIHYPSRRLPFLVSADVGVWVVAPS